jgi:hypothetical protein
MVSTEASCLRKTDDHPTRMSSTLVEDKDYEDYPPIYPVER